MTLLNRSPLPLFLGAIWIFDLEPSDARVVRIGQALSDDALKVMFAHQLEEFAPLPATDSASETMDDTFGRMLCNRRRRSPSGKDRRLLPLSQRMSKVT
jgi:hypothetical protein